MPACDGLFDDVLDRRLVDDGQHLLRHRLRGGEEAGAESGGRNDGLEALVGHARQLYSGACAAIAERSGRASSGACVIAA